MGDDFFDDLDDDSFEPVNDCEEDLFDENSEEGLEKLVDTPDADENRADQQRSDEFDLKDAAIIGTMIAGSAYDDVMAKRRFKESKRNKK